MDYYLRDKKAFVSGSTAGIGLAIAAALAAEGTETVVNGRTPERVEQALKSIRDRVENARVVGIDADLSGPEGVKRVLEAHPSVDILVNNLGIFDPAAFEDISDSEWSRFFETNVMSGVRLSRHYLPKMKANNWGRIVFISSESGVHIPDEMIHYGMTKAAQIAVARGLAETTAGSHVTVNSVLPGPTSSEGVSEFVRKMAEDQGLTFEEMEEKFFREIRPTSLLQRFSTPEEVANMVAYVCSPLSSATNGAALRVEGGVVKAML